MIRGETKILLRVAALLLSLSVAIAGDAGHDLQWLSFDKGLAEAQKSDKKILVDVYTDWCGWCKRMDRDVYANNKVASYLTQQYVLVRVNAESSEELHYKGKTYSEMGLAEEFKVTGYPTILFLDPNGNHITSLPGYVKADEFLGIVKFIGEDYYKTMKWEEYQKNQNSKGNNQE